MLRSCLITCIGLSLVAIGAVASSNRAEAQIWLDFDSVTSTNMVSDPFLGSNDPEEKDYATGDLDGDGDLDLVVARKLPFTTFGNRPNVLFVNVDGVMIDMTGTYAADFISTTEFPNGDNARDVEIGDVDNDGWLDVVIANAGNQGSGGQQPRLFLNLGDDGAGGWLGLEDQSFRLETLTAPSGNNPNFCSVTLGDVTGDGFLDIYFVDYNNDLEDTLMINDGTGNFTEETFRLTGSFVQSGFGTHGEINDLNGDGLLDIVKDTAGSVRTIFNDPSNPGFFIDEQSLAVSAAYSFTIGDVSGDGLNDIYVVQDSQDQIKVNGSPTGVSPVNWIQNSLTNSPLTTGFGGNAYIRDIDGDGDGDGIVTDTDVDVGGCSRTLAFLRNDGGTLSDPYPGGGLINVHHNGVYDVALADFNNDGAMDIWIGHCGGSDLYFSNFDVGVSPVTSLTCEVVSGDVNLSWVNNDVYTAVRVHRDGAVLETLGGGATSFIDPNPGSGTYSYSVFAVIDPDDSAATSCVAVVSNVFPVSNVTCVQDEEDIQLDWVNNGGTFAAQYDDIVIARNGIAIATVPGTTTTYTDLGVPPGNTTYTLTPSIGGESGPAEPCSLFMIDTNLTDLVLRFDSTLAGDTDSSQAIYDALLANAAVALLVDLDTVDDLGILGIDLAAFERVWVELGTFPQKHVLSGSEGDLLAAFVNGGGNVFLSGGDTHCFDASTAIHELTGIGDFCADGSFGAELVAAVNAPSCAPGEFQNDVGYDGEAGLIDRLSPLTTGELLLQVRVGLDIFNAGVLNWVGESMVISHSIEIGGVGEAHDKEDLVGRYISCFPDMIDNGPEFIRGDVNQDGSTDIGDVISLLDHLFSGVTADACLSSLDSNDDGAIDVADGINTLGYLFSSGPPPAAPFPTCGVEDTPDTLTCDTFACP